MIRDTRLRGLRPPRRRLDLALARPRLPTSSALLELPAPATPTRATATACPPCGMRRWRCPPGDLGRPQAMHTRADLAAAHSPRPRRNGRRSSTSSGSRSRSSRPTTSRPAGARSWHWCACTPGKACRPLGRRRRAGDGRSASTPSSALDVESPGKPGRPSPTHGACSRRSRAPHTRRRLQASACSATCLGRNCTTRRCHPRPLLRLTDAAIS